MRKKLAKKQRIRINYLIRLARDNEISLQATIELLQRRQALKQTQRQLNRYGCEYDWENLAIEFNNWIMVPVLAGSKPTDLTRMVLNKEEIPDAYKDRWPDDE